MHALSTKLEIALLRAITVHIIQRPPLEHLEKSLRVS